MSSLIFPLLIHGEILSGERTFMKTLIGSQLNLFNYMYSMCWKNFHENHNWFPIISIQDHTIATVQQIFPANGVPDAFPPNCSRKRLGEEMGVSREQPAKNDLQLGSLCNVSCGFQFFLPRPFQFLLLRSPYKEKPDDLLRHRPCRQHYCHCQCHGGWSNHSWKSERF